MQRIQLNKNIGSAFAILTIAVAFGLYSYFTPIINEDIGFLNIYKSYNGGEISLNLSAIVELAREIRMYDNGRLANFIAPIVSGMLPHWLSAVLLGCAVAFIFWMMTVIARVRMAYRGISALFLCIISLILLPWRDWIITNCYALNYIYSSAVILTFIYILELIVRNRLKRLSAFIGAIIMAILAGWFHEGFAIPVCCGLAVYAFFMRFRLSWKWWLLSAIFALTTLFTAIAPGTLSRASSELGGYDLSDRFRVIIMSLHGIIFMILLCALCLCLKKNECFKLFKRPSFFILFFAGLFAGLLCLSVHSASRASWPAELYSLSCIACLCQPLMRDYLFARHKKSLTIFFILIYLGFIAFFVNLISWQYRFLKQHNAIVKCMKASPTGTIYYDIIEPSLSNLSTLYMATSRQWAYPIIYRVLNDRDFYKTKQCAVIPSSLEGLDIAKTREIPGSAGLSVFNNTLFIKDISQIESHKNADVVKYNFIYDDGSQILNAECLRIKFVDSKGSLRIYIRPKKALRLDNIIRADSTNIS